MRTFGMFSAYQFTLLLRVYVVVGLQKLAAKISGYSHLKIMVNALHLLTSNGIIDTLQMTLCQESRAGTRADR